MNGRSQRSRRQLAHEIVSDVMRGRVRSPFEIEQAYGVSSRQARAIDDLAASHFGPRGRGYDAYVRRVEGILARMPSRDAVRRPSWQERLYETRLARERVNVDFQPLFDHLIRLAEDEKRHGYPQAAGRLLAKARKLTKYGSVPDFETEYGNFRRWDPKLGGRGVSMFSKRVTRTATERDRRRTRRSRRSRSRRMH